MKHIMWCLLGAVSALAVNIDPANAQNQEQSVSLGYIQLCGKRSPQWLHDPSHIDECFVDVEGAGRTDDRPIIEAQVKFLSAVGQGAGAPIGADTIAQWRF
ncbi:MAG: hypothetical protein ABJ327_07200 [Litoreibacter sp.]